MAYVYDKRDVEFIADVYQSVARGAGIEPVIERYTSYFPDIRFSWQAVCLDNNHYYAVRSFNYDEAAFDTYMPIAHLNVIPTLASRFPTSSVVKTEHFLTTAQYEATDIYDLFFRERDELNQSRGLWAYRAGENAAFLGVDIPRRYSLDERETLDASLAAILPHLQGAFSLMLDLDIRRTRATQAAMWLDTLPSAAFVLSEDMTVSRCNAMAEKLLGGGCGISLATTGQIAFNAGETKDRLQAQIGKALLALEPRGPIAIPSPEPSRLSAYCIPLPSGMQDDPVLSFFGTRKRELLLIIVDANDIPRTQSKNLSVILGVTPAEAELISRLCAGGGLREAAEEIGISYNTARNQIAAAAERLGRSRQTELVASAVNAIAQMRGLPGFK